MRQYDPGLWTVPIKGKKATSVQIEQHMINVIQSGAVQPRETVPSHRTIARLNNINRNTALKAYTKLIATGWLLHSRGGKASVADPLPIGPANGVGSEMPEGLPIPLLGSSSATDCFQAHTEHFIDVGRSEINMPELLKGRIKPTMDIQTVNIRHSIDQYIYDHLLCRSFQIFPKNLKVVRGRMECLKCIIGTICNEGDVIINTAPCDITLHLALRQYRLRSINIQMESLLLELRQLLEKTEISAIYVRPKSNYPSCYTLDEASAIELIGLAKKYKFYIIEEDDEHEFWWGRAPIRPLAQLRHEGYVVHCAALSRSTSYLQHLRVIIAPAQLITIINSNIGNIQGYRDNNEEKKIIQLLRANKLATISRQMRLAKQKDMEALHEILQLQLGKLITYEIPETGTALWIIFKKSVDLANILHTINSEGYALHYSVVGRKPTEKIRHMRLDFSNFDKKEAKTIAIRLRGILNKGNIY